MVPLVPHLTAVRVMCPGLETWNRSGETPWVLLREDYPASRNLDS